MKDLRTYLVNFAVAVAGFGNGKLLDESGVATHNDFYYAHHAPVQKYLPSQDFTGADESDDDSDVRDAYEHMVGIQSESVSEWDVATPYVQDDHVIYRGIQFVLMIANNTGSDPFANPDKWLPCFAREDAFVKWHKGDNITGGFDILHNFRDAGYRQYFGWGKYNTGGASAGSGVNYEGFGVHLDGTVITGDATLEAIFDVGGANEYHLLDVIAPDVVGTRTLLDARGAAAAVVDAGGGDREDVGSYQDDAAQRVTGQFQTRMHAGISAPLLSNNIGAFSDGGDVNKAYPTSVSAGVTLSGIIDFDNDDSTSPNASKTDDAETRMKNYSVGVPSVLVINPA